MKKSNDERTLTRAEMEIMNILWDNDGGITTHAIIAEYPEPRPAYSTIATFLRILTAKGFVGYRRVEETGKTHYFFPLIGREEYTRRFMSEVKSTFFAGSLRSLISFFAREEDIADDDLQEILSLIEKNKKNAEL